MTVTSFIKETARGFDPQGRLFSQVKEETCFNYSPEQYYDWFGRYFKELEIWQTNYIHQLESRRGIIDFISGTALLPYFKCLDVDLESQFLNQLHQ